MQRAQKRLEHLDSIVPEVNDVDSTVGPDIEVGRPLELAGTASVRAEDDKHLAVARENLNAMILEIRDVDAALGIGRDARCYPKRPGPVSR